ncbi:TPA: hypothetical protein ACOBSY_002087 [Enterococcus faecium]|jgi:hypothetical protein|nr:hypothetical protein [Enterococcus faecium]EFF25847.1 conserved hypothetical protein [Enterococcus faecium E1679]MBG0389774.1 hypothetical protein [Enterococcus faecium]MBJ1650415.1 hypothetical protein [Enterococcus faecium]MCU7637336.1 hypothetical protein [Enterococcus faecium]MDQ8418328.1 hypothetical protein [Enterococcus faecium]
MSDYLTAEQYEYARKTGDWESGKVLTHGQALNDNQKIVLEWLEEYYAKSQWPFPFYVLKHAANDMPTNIFGFYDDFTMKEEFEVLAAFAQWGLKQEEAE